MAAKKTKKFAMTTAQQRRHTSITTFGYAVDDLTLDMCISADLELEKHFKKVSELSKQKLTENGSIRTGLLRKAIDYKVKIVNAGKDDMRVWGGVGINRKLSGVDEKGNPVKPVKYAHLVEFGHGEGRAKKSGKKIPRAADHPFMRPAISALGGTAELQKIAADGFKKGAEKNAR